MATSSVGVVLCRLAAILLFVRAAVGVGHSVQLFAESHSPVWSILVISILIAAVPAAIGAGIWVYAESISRLSPNATEAELSDKIQPTDLVIVGTVLIGLYAVIFGIVDGFATEVSFWSHDIRTRTFEMPSQYDTAQRVSARIPYIVQVVLGLLLIIGRKTIARLLMKARYAGTGAK